MPQAAASLWTLVSNNPIISGVIVVVATIALEAYFGILRKLLSMIWHTFFPEPEPVTAIKAQGDSLKVEITNLADLQKSANTRTTTPAPPPDLGDYEKEILVRAIRADKRVSRYESARFGGHPTEMTIRILGEPIAERAKDSFRFDRLDLAIGSLLDRRYLKVIRMADWGREYEIDGEGIDRAHALAQEDVAPSEQLSAEARLLLSAAIRSDHKVTISKPPLSNESQIIVDARSVASTERDRKVYNGFKREIDRLEQRGYLRMFNKGPFTTVYELYGDGIEIAEELPPQAMPADAIHRQSSLSPLAEEMLLTAYCADRRICLVPPVVVPARGPRVEMLIKIGGKDFFPPTDAERARQVTVALQELLAHLFLQQDAPPNANCHVLTISGNQEAEILANYRKARGQDGR